MHRKWGYSMNEIKNYTESIFDSIKHIDEFGNEYWEARELQKVLEYKEWRNFKKSIEKAIVSCKISIYKVSLCCGFREIWGNKRNRRSVRYGSMLERRQA